jgi:hypothetical protein
MVWLGPRGGALGKRNQFISQSLVICIGSVLHSFDLPGGRDQEVGRKAQAACTSTVAGSYILRCSFGFLS